LAIPWAHEKRVREDRELQEVESHIEQIEDSVDGGFLSDDMKEALKALEARR
jgi:hypothetical protein